ncbi:hypothetical protein C4559_04550 [Candidatus Microgenomates bacterium]|nr:MAG: hypothetical protein C4559_04550 [Candidatus Microgenomates bacterium]
MTIENRAQSQQPQAIGGERLRAIHYLQKRLGPAQGSASGERLRVSGLRTFYSQMANPTLDFLESVSSSLVAMPYRNLEQLRWACYEAGENPTRYFERRGIIIDGSERISAGIWNAGELVDDISHFYNSDTGKLMYGGELDSKAFADRAFEMIQIRNGDRKIRIMGEQVKTEPDLQRRHKMGLKLKRQVLDHITKFPFSFQRRHSNEEMEPTWENLTTYSGYHTELRPKSGGSHSGYSVIPGAVMAAESAITRLQIEKRLAKLPSKAQDRFEQLRFQYGAKSANLILLSELVDQINRAKGRDFDSRLAVPAFRVVPVDSYKAWREGKLLDGDLQPYYDWASNLPKERIWGSDEEMKADYIVRSSAVFSEDGANITGAGIYESVRVFGGATFQEFRDTVAKVYESVNSPRALAYRAQHEIDEEEMGLLIQKYITPDTHFMHNQSEQGYMNSRLAGVPEFMEIVTETSRNFVRRKAVDFTLGMRVGRNEDAFDDVHHFPPDQFKIRPTLPIKVAQLTSIIERIWGGDIQVEFVVDGFDVNFVQVRELPEDTFSQVPEVKFPDETAIHTGASIGTSDLDLPVLDDEADNSEETGAVVFPSNFMFSMDDNSYRLPKAGVVIIADTNSEGRNGHIQTLCAERGLVCVFPGEYEEDKPTLRYHELSRMKRVRVVSNGIEARLYEGKQENDIKAEEQDEVILFDRSEQFRNE